MNIRQTLALTAGALIAFTLAVGSSARADTLLLYTFEPGSTLYYGDITYAATGTFTYDATTNMVTTVGYIATPGYVFTTAETKSPTDVAFSGDCCGDIDEFFFSKSLALGGTDTISGYFSSPFVGATATGAVFTASPTPLPSTWTMLIAGLAGLGFFAYRGSKKNAAGIAAA